MEEMLKDKRFAHIAKDPKFRRIPKNERKVKIDKRFQSMFKDKNFSIKYTVDKRGRPVNQSSSENLRKYYEVSSSGEDSSDDETKLISSGNKKKAKSDKIEKINEKRFQIKKEKAKEKYSDTHIRKNTYAEENENFSSNGNLLLTKQSAKSISESESEKNSELEESDNNFKKNEDQLKLRKNNEKKLDNNVKTKLRDLSIDYARGEGVLFSDSSSEDESSECEDVDEDIKHNWGELDKEAELTNEITCRLAACNMDWDRLRAVDLIVLFNSFLPPGGFIKSVIIYPSEFGLQRMKEEDVNGPPELVDSKNITNSDNEDHAESDENEEGSSYHMEKLRKYQLNRLKYYYAVIEFDSIKTADKIYKECDGIEYESSATKFDLRFIPDDMIFDQEPREVCNKLPDLSKYKPRLFANTALQQVKVNCTWDETNPERLEIAQKLNSGKLDEIDKNDIQAYLASGTSESESEDEIKKQLDKVHDSDEGKDKIEMYKSLLKSIEEVEEEKKKNEVQLEFTWGLGVKEKTEKLVKEKEKVKQNQNLSPFELYLEKRKAKKKAKRELKKNTQENDNDSESNNEDPIPSDIDMNDPYFAEELKNTMSKSKKRKAINNDDSDNEEEKKHQAELELLLMDENNEEEKHHFSMKRIEKAESLSKLKKKRLSKKKKDLKAEADKDDFEVDVKDPRFTALFTSHHFNIDPADSHYRKTKGTEAFINEKLKRRNNDDFIDIKKTSTNEGKDNTNAKGNAELNTLIRSIKRNTQNLRQRVK